MLLLVGNLILLRSPAALRPQARPGGVLPPFQLRGLRASSRLSVSACALGHRRLPAEMLFLVIRSALLPLASGSPNLCFEFTL